MDTLITDTFQPWIGRLLNFVLIRNNNYDKCPANTFAAPAQRFCRESLERAKSEHQSQENFLSGRLSTSIYYFLFTIYYFLIPNLIPVVHRLCIAKSIKFLLYFL